MKGFKLAAAAGIVAIGLGAAGVATANQVTFNLTGNVDAVCGVYTNAAGVTTVDFGDLSQFTTADWVPGGSYNISYVCNMTNMTRTISSLNDGVLQVNSTGYGIAYRMSHSDEPSLAEFGFSDLSIPAAPLPGPLDNTFATGAFSTVKTYTVSFEANGAIDATNGTFAPTGVYTDVVTVAVTGI